MSKPSGSPATLTSAVLLPSGSTATSTAVTPLKGTTPAGKLRPIPSPINRRMPPSLTFPGHSPSPNAKGRAVSAAGQLGDLDAFHGRLRRDVLLMQTALETTGHRNPMSFDARKLEAEVLRSTHEPTPEDRMVTLLQIMERKVREVAAAATGGPEAARSAASAIVGSASPGGSAASDNGPVIAPLIEALMGGRTLPTPPPSSRGGTDPSGAGDSSSGAGGGDRSASPTVSAAIGTAAAAETALGEELLSKLSRMGIRVGDGATVESVVSELVMRVDVAGNASGSQSLHGSGHMGQAYGGSRHRTPQEEALQPPGVSTPQRLPHSTTNATQQQHLLASPATREGVSLMHQQAVMELDALRAKLAAKDRELSDVRHQLSSSRYAFNAPRTLTTVHDAPMSFEVERQYQKELHRSAGRVKELEQQYAELHRAGEGDRRKVADLTAETDRLRDDIRRDREALAALQKERDEQHSLFSGVSRARGEEARMSLVAVKQLESRVADLDAKLKAKTEECRHLRQNSATLWDTWHAADSELARVSCELGETKDLFEAYSMIFNEQVSQQLEEALREVHRLGRQGDEQTALTTLQKQRIDDAEMLRSLTVHEQQLWMERLKGSTEWKMLNVKSPDETKQLAVRLMMLTGEKEKKENTMLASHGERLSLYKARADREVAERCERREAAMPIVDAAATQARWHGDEETVCERYRRDREALETNGQGGRTTKLRYAEVKNGFLDEMSRRAVDFRTYFNEEVESRAAQDVGTKPGSQ